MPDFLRFPEPDGSTKVINPETGAVWVEGIPDEVPKAAPRTAPFAVAEPESATVVELPTTRGEEAKKAREPDGAEQMTAEADRRTPRAYPAGSPELRNLLRLPFKTRGQAMRLYQAAIDAWNKMPVSGTELDTTDKLERYFGALEAFDDFLACVAVSEPAYRSWVSAVDDGVFGELFAAYITRFGLGEASSSSS